MKVYTKQTDCEEITNPQSGDQGWREKSDGSGRRQHVTFYFGDGWLTVEEWANLRQRYPRG